MEAATQVRVSGVLLALVLLLVVACGGSAAELNASSEQDDSGFLALAATIPAVPGEQVVLFSDIELAAEQFDYVRRCEDDEAANRTVRDLTTGQIDADGLVYPAALMTNPTWRDGIFENSAMRAELGFGVCDIDLYAQEYLYLLDPKRDLSVLRTPRIDQIDVTVRSEPLRSDEIVATETGAATTYVWSDDPLASDFDRSSTARPLGRGGALHVDLERDLVIHTIDPASIDRSLEAGEQGRSLADDELFRLLVSAIEDEGAHSFILVRPFPIGVAAVESGAGSVLGEDPAQDDLEAAVSTVEAIPLARPSVWMAGGWALTSDGGLKRVVIAAHRDDAEAAENVAALERALNEGRSALTDRPWRDRFGSFDVEQRGRLVVATSVQPRGEARPVGSMLTAVAERDTLFAVGEE